MTRFYLKYNPEKLHEVEGVLERFRGKEKQLFNALVKKYGPEPADDEVLEMPEPAQPKDGNGTKETDMQLNSNTAAVQDFNRNRLAAFYEKYNPEKLSEVDTMLNKYKGREAQLFNALVKKYGPEPGDSDDEDDEANERKPRANSAYASGKDEGHGDEDEEDEEDNGDEEDDGEPRFKHVEYCPVDGLPAEYCEYGPMFNEAKVWLAEHCPKLYLQKYNRTVEEFLEAERQIAEGVEGITLEASGKTMKKKKTKKTEGKSVEDVVVHLAKSSRKGRKQLTFITGLEDLEGINMKDATKKLGKRFACSSSLSKTDVGKQQIQLQGDCIADLTSVLPEMFGISEDQIIIDPDRKK